MKKTLTAFLAAGALITLMASSASAHVTVWPKETTTGAYEKYTVRVPVEKEVATTKVRLEFPADVKVSTVKPTPGWDYAWEKDSEGRNTALVWTATAGGINAGEFAEFELVGANPKEVGTGTLEWKATQTYADNTVVEWTGAQDSKTPASLTTITQGASDGHSHGGDTATEHTDTAHNETAASTPAATTEEGSSFTQTTLPLILSGAALLLALVSLFRKRA